MASIPRARVNNLNDRAKDFGIPDRLTLDDVRAVSAFYDFTCLKCGANPAISVDHVIPLSKGGANRRENCQNLCTECNKQKKDDETDYRKGVICPDDFSPEQSEPKIYRTIDWFSIENDYITTNLSIRDLSEKYAVSVGEIGLRSSAEKWTEKRKQFQNETRTRMIDVVAQARADKTIEGIDLCDTIITSFMREMARGKAKVTAFDAMAAARFREVLRGGVSSRSETVHKDWRDFAKDAGLDEDEVYAEFERIANDRARETNAGGGSFGGREQEEYGAGWSD